MHGRYKLKTILEFSAELEMYKFWKLWRANGNAI